MIELDDYFGPYVTHPEASAGKWSIADILLSKVNDLIEAAEEDGLYLEDNPNTGSLVSGSENGGFRPKDCTVGHPRSEHKKAHAVDIYDPENRLDDWIDDELLVKYKLWREDPEFTKGWVHLQDVPPRSGKRSFIP